MKKLILLFMIFSVCIFGEEEMIEKTVFNTAFSIKIETGDNWVTEITPAPFVNVESSPQLVVWLEDSDGGYIETLYLTEKMKEWVDKNKDPKKQHRIETLPYWSYKKPGEIEIDGVAGASPIESFDFNKELSQGSKIVKLFLEINASMDFNKNYTKKGKKKTIKSGYNGQPSIIYMSEIDLSDLNKEYNMNLIGHGSIDGSDGNLYEDLSKIDSAKKLIKNIEIEVK